VGGDPFIHLHVASGYSLQYGASAPGELVAAAASSGMPALALTDRDGLYGAVKFVQSCEVHKVAPIVGVDLAVDPSGLIAGIPSWADPTVLAPGRARNPVRGGGVVDPRFPRVTVLALGADRAAGRRAGAGWGRLCRLVTATQLRGERGRPVTTPELVARYARVGDGDGGGDPQAPAALVVMLGPDSEFGRAVLARRPDLALTVLRRWRALLPPDALAVEVVHHRGPEGTPGSRGHAVRMLQVAHGEGVPTVLTNAVRYAARDDAVTVDVLDAARRLVTLDSRHLDRTTAEGYLAPPTEMARRAEELAYHCADPEAGRGLLRRTAQLARRCVLDPRQDLGFGAVHLPEKRVLGLHETEDPMAVLHGRCAAAVHRRYPDARGDDLERIRVRLEDELRIIEGQDIPAYFLTVATVQQLIAGLGVRAAARGSGAGSLVNYLLGISGVDPMAHRLLMERFYTGARVELPDIDIDVESARRTDVYAEILRHFGDERVACVSMMDTYRVRHAVRDAGAALGMVPGEIDTIAKAFPHIRARDVRNAIAELPELRATGLGDARLDLLFDLVERLDGLPRHVALHPCGVLLGGAGLLDRTPVEASWLGFPMSQFDKDDVETLGMLKLDILGIRMQSAMAHAIEEVARVDDTRVDLDAVPLDDEPTFELIRTTRTLGCFQIESPGQRELIGRFGPETFGDLIIDISLFRPGPVKSDMIAPFLRARQGWERPSYLHPSLRGTLEETHGVVVFHEQVLGIVATVTGCDLEEADEVRRTMGTPAGQERLESWFSQRAYERDYTVEEVSRIWEVLKAFASFGFCKAHAAAFALPTYHSAYLKAHHPAAFLAGVLTHDPGMYPKRLILDDARNLGIAVLGLDVNRSDGTYRVELLADDEADPDPVPIEPGLPDGSRYGIRLSLAEVKGISAAEVERIVAHRPYHSLADLWHRAHVSRPVVENLVLAGALDPVHGLGGPLPGARGRITRRDLLVQLHELERWTRSVSGRVPGARGRSARAAERARPDDGGPGGGSGAEVPDAPVPGEDGGYLVGAGSAHRVQQAAARQSQAPRRATAAADLSVQLALDLGDAPDEIVLSGLPEMTDAERVRAELEVLGLDASRHIVDFYAPMLDELGTVRARDVLRSRSRAEILVAGVKVATQTPPIRTGRRVVFLTLDDSTGPVDATFFEDVQGPYAATVFHSWLLVVRGVVRRTGNRGVSLRATGAWELPVLWDAWTVSGVAGVRDLLAATGTDLAARPFDPATRRLPFTAFDGGVAVPAAAGTAAPGRVTGTGRDDGALPRPGEVDWEPATGLPSGDRARPAAARPAAASAGPAPGGPAPGGPAPTGPGERSDGPGGRRVLVHPSGYRQSPYADLKPPGDDTRETRRMLAAEEETRGRREAPRKLWHASPGSSGH
jgi:error-prone DNA polymerase